MPSSDPAVEAHHCRLGKNTPEIRTVLQGLKGWVVVSHEGGKTGEHSHLHCFIQHSEPCCAMTVKNRLKKHEVFKEFKGNGDWSFRSHDSLQTWWDYVWKDEYETKKPSLVCWNLDIPQFDIPPPRTLILPKPELTAPGNIIAIGPISEHRRKQKVNSSLEKQQKFYRYCKEYYDGTDKRPTAEKVLKLLYEYCKKNGFTTESCCFVWVNYALANLSTGDAYKECRGAFVSRLANKFF